MPYWLIGKPRDRSARQAAPPARLNLSATQLESIFITATDHDHVDALMPELLPRTLVHMHVFRSSSAGSTEHYVHGPQHLLDSAAKLLALRSLSATCDLAMDYQLHLGKKFERGICLSVQFRGTVCSLVWCGGEIIRSSWDRGLNCYVGGFQSDVGYAFEAAASLHIECDVLIIRCDADLRMLPRALCPNSLQDCVLHASEIRFLCDDDEVNDTPVWDVVRMLLKHRSSAFAFACGIDDDGRTLLRWRRWPAPGSVAWHEAAAAHEATWLEARQRLSAPPSPTSVGQPAEDDDAQSDASSWLARRRERGDLVVSVPTMADALGAVSSRRGGNGGVGVPTETCLSFVGTVPHVVVRGETM